MSRLLRVLVLAVAAWAVLFAPGVLAGERGSAIDLNADAVGASVLAPTFGSDALLNPAACRKDAGADTNHGELQASVATLSLVATAGVASSWRFRRPAERTARFPARLFERRGPPSH